MPALPILLALAGYWVMYAGVKHVTLLDAYRCKAQQQQTGTPQAPGSVSIGQAVQQVISGDCRPRSGDTKLPGGFIWRPIGSGVLGQVNGQLVGPC